MVFVLILTSVRKAHIFVTLTLAVKIERAHTFVNVIMALIHMVMVLWASVTIEMSVLNPWETHCLVYAQQEGFKFFVFFHTVWTILYLGATRKVKLTSLLSTKKTFTGLCK